MDERFRICGDYRQPGNCSGTVPAIKAGSLFTTLTGVKIFSKIGLSQAYLQLRLADASIPFVTINTHQGLYLYTHLPFGVALVPAILPTVDGSHPSGYFESNLLH